MSIRTHFTLLEVLSIGMGNLCFACTSLRHYSMASVVDWYGKVSAFVPNISLKAKPFRWKFYILSNLVQSLLLVLFKDDDVCLPSKVFWIIYMELLGDR